MFRNLAFLIIPLLLTMPMYAQSDTLEKTVLWKVEHDKIDKPIYVYGTIHEICLEKMFWSTTLDSLIAESDEVVFEVDMVKHFKNFFNIGFADFASYRDSLIREYSIEDAVAACSAKASYEQAFVMTAAKHKKRLGYLESVLSQVWALYSFQVRANGKSNNANHHVNSNILEGLYAEQDIQKMYEWIVATTNTQQLEVLLFKRNMKWVEKMNNYLFASPAKKLFVVGAGHLAGDNGLINLLRMSGFTVTPVFLQTN